MNADRTPPPPTPRGVTRALDRLPAGQFILTAAYDGSRAGVPVSWVQQCSDEPPMVVVAVRKGQPIDPLIRDARSFCLCQLARGERYLFRRFSGQHESGDDPFLSTPTRTAKSGAPILERAISYLDCELIRHIDIESEYELFVGLIQDGELLSDGEPEMPRPMTD